MRYATHENLGRTCTVGYIVNNSRAITLHLLGTDKYETSDAHLHMLVNIPVKSYDSGSYTFLRYATHKNFGRTEARTDKGKSICPPF